MTDTMLPIIRQMHGAPDDRARALILLQLPDAVLAKYRDAFAGACRRAAFAAGLEYLERRCARWRAVRGPDGLVHDGEFDRLRESLAAFARGLPAGSDDAEHGATAPNARGGDL